MAIAATDAGACVDALAPKFKLAVLGFVNLRAGFPTGTSASSCWHSNTRRDIGSTRTDASLAASPWCSDRSCPGAGRSPVADAGQVRHRVVTFGQFVDAQDESRPQDAKFHRVGIVAIQARNRVSASHVLVTGRDIDSVRSLFDFGVDFFVSLPADGFESRHHRVHVKIFGNDCWRGIVTVHTRLRIIAQVAGTFAVAKRERADTGEYAQRQRKYDRGLARTWSTGVS